jgi:hypothetical protein
MSYFCFKINPEFLVAIFGKSRASQINCRKKYPVRDQLTLRLSNHALAEMILADVFDSKSSFFYK